MRSQLAAIAVAAAVAALVGLFFLIPAGPQAEAADAPQARAGFQNRPPHGQHITWAGETIPRTAGRDYCPEAR
jgi:hypothetical protein